MSKEKAKAKETDFFEKFRKMITRAKANGQTALLIWRGPEERKMWGGDEKKMMVEDAFLPHGTRSDGKAYGEYRDMELDRAIRGALDCDFFFALGSYAGEGTGAMLFRIESLLAEEGHLQFACRWMMYGRLNGPIVAYPSYDVVDFEIESIVS